MFEMRDAFDYWLSNYSHLEDVLGSVLKKSRPAINKEEQAHIEMLTNKLTDVTRHLQRLFRKLKR